MLHNPCGKGFDLICLQRMGKAFGHLAAAGIARA
jgi:hypothetical protein